MKRLHLAVPIALLVAGLLLGCGGSGERTLTTSSLGRTEFVDRAEAICEHGRIQGLRYAPSTVAHQSEREVTADRIKENLLPAIQATIDRLYELGAPNGEEAEVEELLVALQGAVAAAEGLRSPTLEHVERLLSGSGRLARGAGLPSCAYG